MTFKFASLNLCLLIMLLLSPRDGATKENPVFDRYYTIIGIKAENERLNNYAFQLQSSPTSRGIIVVYAKNERTVKSAQARARRALNYLIRNCGINPGRISWRYESVCGRYDMVVLYLLYPKETDPERDPKCLRA